VRADAARLLRALGVDAELSVALIGDGEMRALNRRYRRKDRPTDVLSFCANSSTPSDAVEAFASAAAAAPWRDTRRVTATLHRLGRAGAQPSTRAADRDPPVTLGDVVISVDTAARQAAARKVPVSDEVRLLLTHGVLHLLGYDHERSPSEARRMFATQRQLMALLKRPVDRQRLRSRRPIRG
jgi:probable rRNA maturation factor